MDPIGSQRDLILVFLFFCFFVELILILLDIRSNTSWISDETSDELLDEYQMDNQC